MELRTDKKIYAFLYHVARTFMHVFGRMEVRGTENLPEGGFLRLRAGENRPFSFLQQVFAKARRKPAPDKE